MKVLRTEEILHKLYPNFEGKNREIWGMIRENLKFIEKLRIS